MKTDTQLQQDVMAELKWEPAVNSAHIGVEVRDGVVTLAGEVGSYIEKLNAECAAQRVSGIKGLAVEMKVKLLQLGERSDADIAAAARSVLNWTCSLPDDAIQILVEDGWITLSGQVPWNYQRSDAAERMQFMRGVLGVSNQITIKPTLSATVVKSDIVAAINRRAIDEAEAITVEVQGAEVTLAGKVQSWAEREMAIHSAWSSPGVHKVVDKMTLT